MGRGREVCKGAYLSIHEGAANFHRAWGIHKMTQTYFRPKGRLAQKPYWTGVGILMGMKILAAVLLYNKPEWSFLKNTDFLFVFVAFNIGARMKDFDVAPYWGWIGVIACVVIIPLSVIFFTTAKWGHGSAVSAAGLLAVIPLFILIMLTGLWEGDQGPNKYGPPPLA